MPLIRFPSGLFERHFGVAAEGEANALDFGRGVLPGVERLLLLRGQDLANLIAQRGQFGAELRFGLCRRQRGEILGRLRLRPVVPSAFDAGSPALMRIPIDRSKTAADTPMATIRLDTAHRKTSLEVLSWVACPERCGKRSDPTAVPTTPFQGVPPRLDEVFPCVLL